MAVTPADERKPRLSGLSSRARFLVGAAVPAGIVLAVVLFTTGGGKRAQVVPPRPPPAPLPALIHSFASPSIGISGQIPGDWTAIRGPGFVRLRNRDGRALIAIATPGASPSASALIVAALSAIGKTYTHLVIKHGPGDSLGGLPAKSRIVYANNKLGVPIRILLVGARGKRFHYLLEAFTAQHAPVHDLVETQQILIALRLRG